MTELGKRDTLKNVRRISTLLYWICALAILFEISIVPLVIYAPGWVEASTSQMTISVADVQALQGWQKIATLAVMMIPSFVIAYGIYRLRKMFAAFANNIIFNTETIGHFKAFGIALIIQTLISPLTGAASSALATFNRPEGERFISIGLGNSDIHTLFLGGLIIVIAWVLGEAVRIEDENRSFV
jgi:hypothetical protein